MLTILLNLLPKVPVAIAALPEFAALIERAKDMLKPQEQATLKNAYALAKQGSDAANAELAELVRTHTGG